VEVVASLSQGRTAAAQCGLFTRKSVLVIFEPPCIYSKALQECFFETEISVAKISFVIKKLDGLISQIYFGTKLSMFRTVRLSIITSSFNEHSAMVYVVQVCRQLSSRTRMELQFHPDPARKLSTNLFDIHHC